MRNVNLEENELTITAIFQQHTKEETIQTLKEALEVLEQEESDRGRSGISDSQRDPSGEEDRVSRNEDSSVCF